MSEGTEGLSQLLELAALLLEASASFRNVDGIKIGMLALLSYSIRSVERHDCS